MFSEIHNSHKTPQSFKLKIEKKKANAHRSELSHNEWKKNKNTKWFLIDSSFCSLFGTRTNKKNEILWIYFVSSNEIAHEAFSIVLTVKWGWIEWKEKWKKNIANFDKWNKKFERKKKIDANIEK